jgi:hypothetical protein
MTMSMTMVVMTIDGWLMMNGWTRGMIWIRIRME